MVLVLLREILVNRLKEVLLMLCDRSLMSAVVRGNTDAVDRMYIS